jgi:tetratricopeptide (TPR) repeat protein
MAEHLCNQSVRAAANDPPAALRLARLALRVAELAPAEEGWKGRLAGYAWAFVANAERVSSNLPVAESSFATAWKLWSEGEAAGETPFGEWRLHDLEASLRRDQRRFDAALACLERALAGAPESAKVRILLKKQYTFEQAGELQAALAVLEEAAPLLDATPDTGLRWTFEINATSMLCHFGRYAEAEARLPALFQYSTELDRPLDTARVVWLSGRIAVGCGRHADARTAFEKAQHTFSVHRIAFDAGLVSLDLAIIHIEEGRTVEVARLAEDMLEVFRAQRVHREALAAVALFCEAARQGAATLELAQRVRDYLERARRNPRLRFEPQ